MKKNMVVMGNFNPKIRCFTRDKSTGHYDKNTTDIGHCFPQFSKINDFIIVYTFSNYYPTHANYSIPTCKRPADCICKTVCN